jgi:hypothetical protein
MINRNVIPKIKRLDGYKIEDNSICIELKLDKPEQAFDLRDPSPFREKDLDDDFVDFFVSAAQEFNSATPMKLHIYFSERNLSKKKKKPITDNEIAQAIRNHFLYLAKLTDKKLRKLFKSYQLFLLMGLAVLILFLFIAKSLESLESGQFVDIAKTGFEIIAWVGAWRPIEMLLYDLWPVYEKRKTYQKIANLEIKITDTQTEQTTIHFPDQGVPSEPNQHIPIKTGN